jgi:hypothetical protein
MEENFTVYANKTIKALNDAIVVSRLSHWNVRGPNFYECHLLFERVYTDLSGQIDGLVESLRALQHNPDFALFSGPGISMQNYDCRFLAELSLDFLMSLSATLALFFEFVEGIDGDPRLVALSNRIQGISDAVLTDQYLLQAYLGM